jgi:hypothetical protein
LGDVVCDTPTASAAAAVISAIGGLFSLGFALFVFWHTRGLLRPFERPVLSLVDAQSGQDANGKIGYGLKIKNSGQRPATTISFQARAAPESDLDDLTFLPKWAPANDYQPGGEMTLMLWPVRTFSVVTLMQVAVSYADVLSNTVFNKESYWLVVHPGTTHAVTGMNQTQRAEAEARWAAKWP